MVNTNKDTNAEVTSSYRFSLYGLILFSLCLMAATAVISSRLYSATPKVAPVVVASPPPSSRMFKSARRPLTKAPGES